MDFWNRLIGGAGSSSSLSKKQPPPTTPAQRLERFKGVWRSILGTWRNTRENDQHSQNILRDHIKQLTELLIEDSKRSERLCTNFAYSTEIYIAIAKIGQGGSQGVIKESMLLFQTLIENEDENFLAQNNFAQSLIGFLRRVSERLDPRLKGEFAELLFNISSKIRQSPEILPVWFTSNSTEEEETSDYSTLDKQQKFVGLRKNEDFPLLYLLLDNVTDEGRVGDFARTGLLYIIGAASKSPDFERWLIESDLSTLMASGLGALYSQLSRKLIVRHSTVEPPTILTLSDYEPPHSDDIEVVSSSDENFQAHLGTFLSYLIFWQDVLEHCKSSEVKQTLLDHFKILFLQQLLYPSLIESSDRDGGSAVAVLTYVQSILDTLDHRDLIDLILSYLMALPPDKPKPTRGPLSPSVARRRKSLDLLTEFTKQTETPDLYNLVDLVLTNMESKSQQTVSATLRLVSTILRKHHPYSISTLLKVKPVDLDRPLRTIGAHNKEISYLFNLINEIGGDDETTEASYEACLKDNLILLESHACTAIALEVGDPEHIRPIQARPTSTAGNRALYTHTLRHDDPLLRSIVRLLSTFFSNTVETNLILTCVIVDLASCCYMKLEGWLLPDPSDYEYDDESEDETEEEWAMALEEESDDPFVELERKQIRDLKRARKEPSWRNAPPILEVLHDLSSQVNAYREEILDLNEKIAERKRAFHLPEYISEALLSSPMMPPQRNPFLENIRNSVMPSSSSPRGRQNDGTGVTTPTRLVRASSNLGLTSTPSPIRGLSPGIAASPSPFGSHIVDTAQRKVRALHPAQFRPPPPEEDGAHSVPGSTRSMTPAPGTSTGGLKEEFSLSHLLTNILILQEFIIEIAALTQVRASLFEDVKFL